MIRVPAMEVWIIGITSFSSASNTLFDGERNVNEGKEGGCGIRGKNGLKDLVDNLVFTSMGSSKTFLSMLLNYFHRAPIRSPFSILL